jgi:hypothetical protein
VLFTQVADETDDVLGDQAPDGAAGVHANHDPAAGVEHEPGRLQEQRIIVDERAGRIGDRRSVGAVPHQEPQAVLGDELPRGGLIVHRQRHDRDIHLGEAVQRLLERAELGVAVRAPGPSVEQDDAEMSGQVIRQAERTAARKADGERRERVVGVQQRLVGHARLARMAGAVLPAGGRCPGPRRRGWRSVSGHRRALRACGPRGEDFETLLAAVRDAAN